MPTLAKLISEVIKIMRKSKHEMTTNDIAKNLNLHRETIKEHLEKLEKKGIVQKRTVYFNRWGVIEKPSCKRYYWRLKNV